MKISIKVRGLVVNALRGKRRAALDGILVGNGLFFWGVGRTERGGLGGSLVVGEGLKAEREDSPA